MGIKYTALNTTGCLSQSTCLSKDGCPPNRCPDFVIKRHDTRPALIAPVEECGSPMDFRGLVVEVSMWAVGKLKVALAEEDTYLQLADDVGFEQAMVGDIIVMDRARFPEHMLVTGFDEVNKLIQVERGYHSTPISVWSKATKIRIFRILNAPAKSSMTFEDIVNVDGTTDEDQLTSSSLIYEWQTEDTCLPGCYWLEFIVMKMQGIAYFLPGGNWTGEVHQHTDGFYYTGIIHTDSSVKLSYDQVENRYLLPNLLWAGEIHESDGNYFTGSSEDDGNVLLTKTGIPSDLNISYDETGQLGILSISNISFTDPALTPADFGCSLAEGVEWVRKFPTTDPLLIRVIDSPTTV